MGAGSSSESGEESEVAIALAIVISIVIIIIIVITIVILFFTDRLPFIDRTEILYQGDSRWKHVNRYGDTKLKFVSYTLKEVREKRRQSKLERRFPPPVRRPETYYDSQSFGTDDNYSINVHSYVENTPERDGTIQSPRSEVIYENPPQRAEKKKKRKKKRRQLSPEKEPRSLPGNREGGVRSSAADDDVKRKIREETSREFPRYRRNTDSEA